MKFTQIKKDLFTLDNKYILAHCISADSGINPKAMGLGIVKKFNKRYKIKSEITRLVNNGLVLKVGDCIPTSNGKVCNLITKKVYYGKPTLVTLAQALENLKDYMVNHNMKYLGIPKIGCGLDKLQWGSVEVLIQDVFRNTDIEIVACCI